MQDRLDRLFAPFPASALRWRVIEIDTVEPRARLAPELASEAVIDRLDEVVGRAGWSNRFLPLGSDALIGELSVDGVTKSAVVRIHSLQDDPESLASWALSRAARLFGMQPPAPPETSVWVDADPETGEPLHPPELSGGDAATAFAPRPTSETAAKPAGQQAIDRLLDRLREEGLGLESAKLLIEFGGYGDDPDTARDLYTRLRALLKDRPVPQ